MSRWDGTSKWCITSQTHTQRYISQQSAKTNMEGHLPSENGSWDSHWYHQSSHWLRRDGKRRQKQRDKRWGWKLFSGVFGWSNPLFYFHWRSSVCVPDSCWLTEESRGVHAGDCDPPPLPSRGDMKHYLATANHRDVCWACVCGVKDSSRLLEAQPTAAETRSSAHSWQLCQQHELLHQEARCGSQCSSTSGPRIAPPTRWEEILFFLSGG